VTVFDVYEATIALSVPSASHKLVSGAGAPSVPKPHPADPKSKAGPAQWSVQEVLFAPIPTTHAGFGSSVSLDKDRLAVADYNAVVRWLH
jgi:hypothetical protein